MVKRVLENGPSALGAQLTLIRSYAAKGDLESAERVFEELEQSAAEARIEMNSVFYNTLLEACAECRDLEAAQKWINVAREKQLTDVVSYNTLIKAHLSAITRLVNESGWSSSTGASAENKASSTDDGADAVDGEDQSNQSQSNQSNSSHWKMNNLSNLNNHSRRESNFSSLSSRNRIREEIEEKFAIAHRLVREMRFEGIDPNRLTYNELVNALSNFGGGTNRELLWRLIDEMEAADIRPNHVTCSILLKSLTSQSSNQEVSRVMGMVERLPDTMDEVLLSSVVEACVRIDRIPLLSRRLKAISEQLPNEKIRISGAHTYGSLIKAYGYAKDVDGVWRCWDDMRARGIRPTSIRRAEAKWQIPTER